MITGGIADKLGNGYEALWTTVQLMEVVLGRAEELRFEPINEDADGFEFRLTRGGSTEWHQCKRRGHGGSWSLRALTTEGVLHYFAQKLSQPNTICAFVSGDPTSQLKTLVDKANLLEGADDFVSALSKEDASCYASLRQAWHVDGEQLHQKLRRIRVETASEGSLRRQLQQLCSVVFLNDPDVSVALLLSYLHDHLTNILTTERVRSDLPAAGLVLRYGVVDLTVDDSIKEATNLYLSSFTARGVGGEILLTSEVEQALSACAASDSQSRIIIEGRAGGGKSTLLTSIISKLRAAELPVLALRMDRWLASQTLSELGHNVTGREESPVATLAHRFLAQKCVLVIDQADAVSEASGRSARARDLMFEMIQQARFFPSMTVIVACRTYDIQNDSRLSDLANAEGTTRLNARGFDWTDQVAPTLAKYGVDTARFTVREQQLLSEPLNLALAVDLLRAGEVVPDQVSTGHLIDELLRVRDRELWAAGETWSASSALVLLANLMSDHQELSAPISALREFPGGVDRLSSMGLISASGSIVQFAHETFFDHIFAQAFLSKNQSVLEFLQAGPQRLFRRTQIRQIFALLRERGGRRYLMSLTEVMNAPNVRYLVKDAIGNWLAAVPDPTDPELRIAVSWFGGGHPLDTVARAILSSSTWFDAVHRNGLLPRWIDGEENVQRFARWVLSSRASTHPTDVANIWREWWAKRDDRVVTIIEWFSWVHPEGRVSELERLYLDLIAVAPSQIFECKKLPPRLELGAWVQSDSASAARILGAWLGRWLSVFPDDHPFGRERQSQDSSYWVIEIAQKAPKDFLKNIVPLFAESLRRERISKDSDYNGYSEFTELEPDDTKHPWQIFPLLLRRAFKAVAQDAPALADTLLDQIPVDLGVTAMHLHLETIAAGGSLLGYRLPRLLESPYLLEAGYRGVKWSAFALAARAAIPHLTPEERAKIENVALSYWPELDYARRAIGGADDNATVNVRAIGKGDRQYIVRSLARSGEAQRAILVGIGNENLSARAQIRLQELQRKFGRRPLPEPLSPRGGWVRSPIDQKAAAHMSDAQWLRAIDHYNDESVRTYLKDDVIGGSRELGRMLQAQVKEDPERFAGLLERIPRSANVGYVESVLDGVAESDASEAIGLRVAQVALSWANTELDRSLCWLVRKFPELGINPEVLSAMLKIASCGRQFDDQAIEDNAVEQEILTVQQLLDGGGGLHIRGFNGDRGAAHEALAGILWEVPNTFASISDHLEIAIRTETKSSVRACMMHTINAVGKYDSDRALDLLNKMIAIDPLPFASRAGLHVMSWAAISWPARVESVIAALLSSHDTVLHGVGLFLLSGQALEDELKEQVFRGLWANDVWARRFAAFRAAGNLSNDRLGERAESWIRTLLFDADREVRMEAARCDWAEIFVAGSDRLGIAEDFVRSEPFENECDRFMMTLEDRIDQFPDMGLAAIERIINLSKSNSSGEHRGHHLALHHLGQTLVRLYRVSEDDPVREAKVVDLIDEFLRRNTDGVRQALAQYERL